MSKLYLIGFILQYSPRTHRSPVTVKEPGLEPTDQHLPGVENEEDDDKEDDGDGGDNDGDDLHVLDPGDPGAGTLHKAAVQIQTGHISIPENCRISKEIRDIRFRLQ